MTTTDRKENGIENEVDGYPFPALIKFDSRLVSIWLKDATIVCRLIVGIQIQIK